MSLPFKRISQIHLIIALRSVAILIQLLLILFVNLGLNYQLPWTPLFVVIFGEVLFTLASFYYFSRPKVSNGVNKKSTEKYVVLIQIIADILFLSLLLYFSGGATNAFVSLLLIPIAIAAVTLPASMLGVVAGIAIISYSILLALLPMSVMHGNMQGHFIAMWINFLFSTLVVAIVVGKMARSINKQELAISVYREELLKQEQVISLGVASAQVTHQLATPIATVQLLADELKEDFPENVIIDDMQKELLRCRDSLQSFRQMTFDIKEQTTTVTACPEVVKQIQDHIALNYPDINVKISSDESNMVSQAAHILADASLLPSLLNLINNAVRATKANQQSIIELSSTATEGNWLFAIRDYGKGFSISKLSELGVKPVDSKQGFGMAVFLSHASLERLGGKLSLTNHKDGGALVTLSLPLISKAEQ